MIPAPPHTYIQTLQVTVSSAELPLSSLLSSLSVVLAIVAAKLGHDAL